MRRPKGADFAIPLQNLGSSISLISRKAVALLAFVILKGFHEN
jgi:hypothetical protein